MATRFVGLVGIMLLVLGGGCAGTAVRHGERRATARPTGRAFDNPQAGWNALVAAARSGSTDEILAILGDEARPFISSADGLNDARARREFLDQVDQHTVLGRPDRGVVMAYLGDSRWPFPIPIVRGRDAWRFDTAVGAEALVERRIRYDEMRAVAVCRAYAWAQHEYAARQLLTSPRKEYARRLISTPGTRDGLYWPAVSPADKSPMAPLVTAAQAEGYRPGPSSEPVLYYGYLYRPLTAQGPHAPGGAHSYLEGDSMTRGFALVAWPAQYGVTGTKTLIMSQDEIIHQRDLGPQTAAMVDAMTAYDPDPSWTPVP
jgi:hypothetical protein